MLLKDKESSVHRKRKMTGSMLLFWSKRVIVLLSLAVISGNSIDMLGN